MMWALAVLSCFLACRSLAISGAGVSQQQADKCAVAVSQPIAQKCEHVDFRVQSRAGKDQL